MIIKVYIASVERTSNVKALSLSIRKNLDGHQECDGEIEELGSGYRPAKGSTFKVSDGGSPEAIYFAGFIHRIVEKPKPGTSSLIYSFECVDYNIILARRRILLATYENLSLYDIVDRINTNFLNGEGITLGGVTNPGPTITERLEFRGHTVLDAFNELARVTGYVFNLGADKDLDFSLFASNPAPFNFTDSTGEWVSASLEIERDDSQYRNRQHVRSQLAVASSAGSISGTEDPITALAGQTSFPTSAITREVRRITVNGIDKTFVGVDPTESIPGSGYDFYYFTEGFGFFALDWGPAAGGEIIEIDYLAGSSYTPPSVTPEAASGVQIITVNDTAEQATRVALEGGSGIHEHMVERRNVTSPDALRVIGEGELRQHGTDVIKIRIASEKNDALLEPTQRITFNVTAHAINESFLIESVEWHWLIDADGDYFRQTVELTNGEPASPSIRLLAKLAEVARIGPFAGGGAGADPGHTDRGGEVLDVIQEIPKGIVNGTNRTFYTTYVPDPALIWITAGGRPMNPFLDYALTAPESKFVYTDGVQPKSGEEHWVWYFHGALRRTGSTNVARKFSGGTDGIVYGNNAIFRITGDLAIGLWLKLPSNAVGCILQYGVNGSSEAENHNYGVLVVGASGAWDIQYFHDHDNNQYLDTLHDFNANIANDVWRYVGITRNATAKTITLYIGTPAGVVTLIETWVYPYNTTGGTDPTCKLTVGHQNTISPLKGTLQEHYLANVAWTQAQHESAMRGDPPLAGLVLSVPILGASPEVDVSSTGASGTVTGTTVVAGR